VTRIELGAACPVALGTAANLGTEGAGGRDMSKPKRLPNLAGGALSAIALFAASGAQAQPAEVNADHCRQPATPRIRRVLVFVLGGWLSVACRLTPTSDDSATECNPDLSVYEHGFQKPAPSSAPLPFVTSELPGYSIALQVRPPARASASEANLSFWMSGAEDLDYDALLRWGTDTPSQGTEIAMLLFIDGILMPFAVEGSAGAVFRRTLTPGSSALLHVHVPSARIADGAHQLALMAFPTSGGGMLHVLAMKVLYKNSTAFADRPPVAVQAAARYPERSGRGLIDPSTNMPAPFLEVAPSSEGDLPIAFSWENSSIFLDCPAARQDVLFAAILDCDRQIDLGELGLAPRTTLVGADRIQANILLRGLPVNDGQSHSIWFLAFPGYAHHFEVPHDIPTIWSLDAFNGKVGRVQW
jgi:hypothetical protein